MPDIDINIQGQDNFTASAKSASKAFDELSAAQKKTSTGAQAATGAFNGFKSGIANTIQSVTGLSLSQAGLAAGLVTLFNVTKKAITGYIDYAMAMDKLALVAGTTVEETSRLVQVADDYRVEQGALENAMRNAVQNGYQPTIENIAQLADKFRGIQDPLQRAAAMEEVFGRQWRDMLPLLEAGGEAIRENAAAVAAGLVVTEEQVKRADEARLAIDNWNDSWQAFTNTLASQALPALTAAIDELMDAQVAIDGNRVKIDGLGGTYITLTDAQKGGINAAEDWNSEQREAARAAQNTTRAVRAEAIQVSNTSEMIDRWGAAQRRNIAAQERLDQSAREQVKTQKDLAASVQETAAAYNRAKENATDAFGNKAAAAMEKYTQRGKKYEQWLEAVDKATGSNRLEAYKAEQSLDKLALGFLNGTVKAEDLQAELEGQQGTWALLDEDLARAASGFKEANLMYGIFLDSLNESNGKHFQVSVDVAYGSGGGGGGTGSGGGSSGGGNGGATPLAAGGPAITGSSYWVGEKGIELYTPAKNGRITSNADIKAAIAEGLSSRGGGGGVNITGPITVVANNVKQLYNELAREAGKRQRSGYGYAGSQ